MSRKKLSRLSVILFSLVICSVVNVSGMLNDGKNSFCRSSSAVPFFSEQSPICHSDYCTCHAYSKLYCSCISKTNSEVPQEVILSSSGPCSIPVDVSVIHIEECPRIVITQESLKGLKGLRVVELANIKDVAIQSYGFHWNETLMYETYHHGVRFNFTNVTIPDIPSYAFKGRIQEVIFHHVYIGMIRSFAFSSMTGTNAIKFYRTNLANLEAQSFKKITMLNFVVTLSRFNVIPSRFMNEVFIENEFTLETTFIDTIRTLAIKVRDPKKTSIINTRINNIEAEAFKISTRGEVFIKNNAFENIENGAFSGFSVEKHKIQESGRQLLIFQNNTIGYFKDRSLAFNNTYYKLYFDRVLIDELCTCEHLELWKESAATEEDESDNIIIYWCHPDDTKEVSFDYVQGKLFYEDNCESASTSVYFFVLVIVLTAIGFIILAVCVICYIKHKRIWKRIPTTAENAQNTERSQNKLKNEKHPKTVKTKKREETSQGVKTPLKGLIVPDGRTYKETELHVIVERAEPLKLTDPYVPPRASVNGRRAQ